jgi:hypothetical protein
MAGGRTPNGLPFADLAAVAALCDVRTDELIELKQQLLLNPAEAPEELNPAPEKSSIVIS